MNKAKETPRMSSKDIPWQCKCGFLLGIVSTEQNVLRIKYKDLYLSVSGSDAKVTQLCRRCATPNVLDNKETPEQVDEKIKETGSAKTEEKSKEEAPVEAEKKVKEGTTVEEEKKS